MSTLLKLWRRLRRPLARSPRFEYFHDAQGVLHRRGEDGTVEYSLRNHWHIGRYKAQR